MKKFKPPYYGAAYYPEDWPMEQIKEDIKLMKKTGMNCMRIGEFAWNSMEPREGEYNFGWLHKVVDLLGENGIATIMGTPTCTPPAWLYERYPEIVVVDWHGDKRQHGARRHACPNSPVYREHCARIVEAMAKEFGNDENVIGWQIDNELYPPVERGCFCNVCVRKFQNVLRDKYGTVKRLNKAWCNNLWSQAYDSFSQIYPPRPDNWHHPSLIMLWLNFISDSYIDFCAHQAKILHKYVVQPVGTDMMPFLGVAYEPIHQHLDIVQYNHYHQMNNLWEAAFWYDYLRPIKNVPFWNTETATCWNGSTTANGYKEKGFCRANSWLPFAFGGEANLYWLWREHWTGQELMHSGVISSCGRPLYVFDEVLEISAGLKRAANFLNNTMPEKSAIALHVSSKAKFLFEAQPIVNGFVYPGFIIDKIYKPLLENHLRMDCIDPALNMDGYKVILSPFLPDLNEAGLKDRIIKWVKKGGIWLVGPFTDIRDENGAKFTHAPYGNFEEWLQVTCKYQIPAPDGGFEITWNDGTVEKSSLWCDVLQANKECEVLARYSEGPIKGFAAIVQRRIGKGRIILCGTLLSGRSLVSLLTTICKEKEITRAADASPNVLVMPRTGRGGEGMVVVEVFNKNGYLSLERAARNILDGKIYKGQITINPYSVYVFKFENH